MTFQMTVECPECGKHWTVPLGTPDVTCNCHLYCEDGSKPSDCTVTAQSYSGPLNWPKGLHVEADDDSDNIINATYYCSTHSKYYYKRPVIIDCDWDQWFSRRAPHDMRFSKGQY